MIRYCAVTNSNSVRRSQLSVDGNQNKKKEKQIAIREELGAA